MKLTYILIIAVVCLIATASRIEHEKVQEMIRECQKESGSTVNEITNIKLGIINPDTVNKPFVFIVKWKPLIRMETLFLISSSNTLKLLLTTMIVGKNFKTNVAKLKEKIPKLKLLIMINVFNQYWQKSMLQKPIKVLGMYRYIK
ncbi:unnamed protein product [Diabrotica balteata]|uniref:Uncharacterized protein n=1 Tax=Diabrotica balteata TaxID=107213 RepID=A0A9P0E0S6_DIABA|nr:unnamed protein product [Diabrotica balteata]